MRARRGERRAGEHRQRAADDGQRRVLRILADSVRLVDPAYLESSSSVFIDSVKSSASVLAAPGSPGRDAYTSDPD